MRKLFISHSWQDDAFVRDLQQTLELHDVDAWRAFCCRPSWLPRRLRPSPRTRAGNWTPSSSFFALNARADAHFHQPRAARASAERNRRECGRIR